MANKIPRVPVREQDPAIRAANFEEVCYGYDLEEAALEASRCLHCKNPRCVAACPVGIRIPDFIAALHEGRLQEAADIISEDSSLPSICGRVCPQESQCEGSCVLGIKGEPVAVGKLECLGVFGDDYDTPDGTGVRDYIHVVDLAKGHVKAVEKMMRDKEGVSIYNLGTGCGYSVLDVLHAYEKACGKTLKYEVRPRRDGDIATCYADCTKAKNELGWVAEKGIEEMCADSWRWQSMNPDGYVKG